MLSMVQKTPLLWHKYTEQARMKTWGFFCMIVLFGEILPTADHEHFLGIFSFTFKNKTQPYIGDSIYWGKLKHCL